MEEAVLRLKIAANAGADVCFIERLRTKEHLESTVVALAPKPVCDVLVTEIEINIADHSGSC